MRLTLALLVALASVDASIFQDFFGGNIEAKQDEIDTAVSINLSSVCVVFGEMSLSTHAMSLI